MLSEREQQIWDDIVRDYERAAGDRPRSELPAVVIGAGWGAVLLVLFGVPMAGVAVGAAAALVWLLWRFLPQLHGDRATASIPDRRVDLLRR